MFKRFLVGLCSVMVVALASAPLAPRAEAAGISQAVMALAGPLAEQFGVPTAGVSGLLEGGLSLDSVTKLLLVSKSSSSSLDSVSKLFNDSGKDIDKTAEQLDVDPAEYSDKKAEKAIRKAKKKSQAAAADEANMAAAGAADEANKAAAGAADGAAEAADSAAGGASKAVDSAIGGLDN